ncbi:XRE family transcriptional regulator [Bifidobacterium dentium]|uniref:XRE family transcriptional regulator n=2 Tax=Bifidobacterium dentium TaxID=1689 RepID=UPI0018B0EE45|nr:XRE family transcriptional regulator [Bifidobacterium dentium]MBF9690501.1 XRE family transcriptional regulator [Bifidobacterium dentium]
MPNMKKWATEMGLTSRQLADQLDQSPASIIQKLNSKTHWQRKDCALLRMKYGLSSDFVQDLVPFEDVFPSGVEHN